MQFHLCERYQEVLDSGIFKNILLQYSWRFDSEGFGFLLVFGYIIAEKVETSWFSSENECKVYVSNSELRM